VAFLGVALLVPVALEGVWRCGYALQMGNLDWLAYPRTHTTLGQRQGAHVATGASGDLPVILPPPGPYAFAVEGHAVTQLTIHEPGFRGQALSTPTPGRLRVAAVGGSSTFSPECGEGQSWPERLEARLGAVPDGPVVFNAGAVGASSSEVLWITENLVLPHNIDLLLVTTAFNDVPAGHVTVDLRPLMAPWHRRALWGRSLFYTAAAHQWMAHQAASGADWTARIDTYARTLEQLVSVSKKFDTRVVFVAQPILEPSRIDLRSSALARRGSGHTAQRVVDQLDDRVARQQVLVERMEAVARATDVPFVDVRDAFVDHTGPQELFELFLHLSPTGADRYATLLAAELEPLLTEKDHP